MDDDFAFAVRVEGANKTGAVVTSNGAVVYEGLYQEVLDRTTDTAATDDPIDFASQEASAVAARAALVDAATTAKNLAAQYLEAAKASYQVAKDASDLADLMNPTGIDTTARSTTLGQSQTSSNTANTDANSKA
ncbi:MAG: hypothetical protein HQL36_11875, partial [Alphaproteobacteria bacterium]|nr:hypothetical protein [Alphaproteobacteria bacterium]